MVEHSGREAKRSKGLWEIIGPQERRKPGE